MSLSAIANQDIINSKANILNLSDSHIWKSLLHLNSKGMPQINTDTFLLSKNNFSPKNELKKTIQAFFENNQSICKYPARYLWLNKELHLDNYGINLQSCDNFNEYIEKTNPINISLVLVSEDVTNPSSMMGHIFFKLDGTNQKGYNTQHSIAFYTVIETLNIPYLALQSTVLGMNGFFVLSPYKEQISKYIDKENRSLVEYKLSISEFQKKLIYYHFWELKTAQITYYFTDFNCATIVDNILKIATPENNGSQENWLTPKDVIKKAIRNKIINKSILHPSNSLKSKITNNDKFNQVNMQNDSQVYISKTLNYNSIIFGILPASNTIFDNNQFHYSENTLSVGEIALKVDNSVQIEKINFFSSKALIPWNDDDKYLSKDIQFNITKHLDKDLVYKHALNTSFGIGLTKAIHNDFLYFGIVGIGIGYGKDTLYPYLYNDLGLIIYENSLFKTVCEYKSYYNHFNNKNNYTIFNATQSIKINDIRVDLIYQKDDNDNISNKFYKIAMSYIF